MTTDRLAALLEQLWFDGVNDAPDLWVTFAARLRAAGVTVAQPAECYVCGRTEPHVIDWTEDDEVAHNWPPLVADGQLPYAQPAPDALRVAVGYFGQHEIDGPCDCGSCAEVRAMLPGESDRQIAMRWSSAEDCDCIYRHPRHGIDPDTATPLHAQPAPDAPLREALASVAELLARFLWDGDTNDGGDDQLVEDAHDLIVRALACERWRPSNLTEPAAAAESAEGCLDCGQAWWAHPATPDPRAVLGDAKGADPIDAAMGSTPDERRWESAL